MIQFLAGNSCTFLYVNVKLTKNVKKTTVLREKVKNRLTAAKDGEQKIY